MSNQADNGDLNHHHYKTKGAGFTRKSYQFQQINEILSSSPRTSTGASPSKFLRTPTSSIGYRKESISNSPETVDLYNESFGMSSPEIQRLSIDSTEEPKLHALENLYYSRPSTAKFAVVRISNIPSDLSTEEVIQFFAPVQIHTGHMSPRFTECIHIVMSRSNGTTLPNCYIEFPTNEEAENAINSKTNESFIRDQPVELEMSSQAELFKALFPNYHVRRGSDIHDGCVFITREETALLLNFCRLIKQRIKTHNAAMPFENIISIMCKAHWEHPKTIATLQRDHLFEMIKLAIEVLKGNFGQKKLMEKLIRCAMCVPLFTEKQKLMLLNVAQIQCPGDLISVVYMPLDEEESSAIFQPVRIPQINNPKLQKFQSSTLWDEEVISDLRMRLQSSKSELMMISKAHKELLFQYQNLQHVLEKLQNNHHEFVQNQRFEPQRPIIKRPFDLVPSEEFHPFRRTMSGFNFAPAETFGTSKLERSHTFDTYSQSTFDQSTVDNDHQTWMFWEKRERR